jgi:AcrR family transcriptional regulator
MKRLIDFRAVKPLYRAAGGFYSLGRMTRTVKTPEARRAEILQVASMLFRERGYAATSVDDIVGGVGVAKGTFYYYFRTKEDVLTALARLLADEMAQRSRAVAQDPSLGAIEKLRAIFAEQRRVLGARPDIMDGLHRPENRELHERSNVETVRAFGPILADVVEEGRRAGIFDVEDPLSTAQFVLAGSLFLFGEGVFDWTPQEAAARTRAMVTLTERALGAAPGSFDGLLRDALP